MRTVEPTKDRLFNKFSGRRGQIKDNQSLGQSRSWYCDFYDKSMGVNMNKKGKKVLTDVIDADSSVRYSQWLPRDCVRIV